MRLLKGAEIYNENQERAQERGRPVSNKTRREEQEALEKFK